MALQRRCDPIAQKKNNPHSQMCSYQIRRSGKSADADLLNHIITSVFNGLKRSNRLQSNDDNLVFEKQKAGFVC